MKIERIVLITFIAMSVIACGDKNNEEQDPVPSGSPTAAQTEDVQPENKKTENQLLCTVLNNATDCYNHSDIQSTDVEKVDNKLSRCVDIVYEFLKTIEQEVDHSSLSSDRKNTLGKVVKQFLFAIDQCREGMSDELLLSDELILEERRELAQCMLEKLTPIKSTLMCD